MERMQSAALKAAEEAAEEAVVLKKAAEAAVAAAMRKAGEAADVAKALKETIEAEEAAAAKARAAEEAALRKALMDAEELLRKKEDAAAAALAEQKAAQDALAAWRDAITGLREPPPNLRNESFVAPPRITRPPGVPDARKPDVAQDYPRAPVEASDYLDDEPNKPPLPEYRHRSFDDDTDYGRRMSAPASFRPPNEEDDSRRAGVGLYQPQRQPEAAPGAPPKAGFASSQPENYRPGDPRGGARMGQAEPLRNSELAPNYRPSDAAAGYRPDAAPNYRQADPASGYRPADAAPNYRQADPASGYRPADAAPNYRQADPASGYRPADAAPNYRQADPASGYRPADSSAAGAAQQASKASAYNPPSQNQGFIPGSSYQVSPGQDYGARPPQGGDYVSVQPLAYRPINSEAAQNSLRDAARQIDSDPPRSQEAATLISDDPWNLNNQNAPLWNAQPSYNPNATNEEVWETIVKNTPQDPESASILQKAADYWKAGETAPPVIRERTNNPERTPRHAHPERTNPERIAPGGSDENSAPDPWGFNDPNGFGYAWTSQQGGAAVAAEDPKIAYMPNPGAKPKRDPAKRDSDYDEDDEDYNEYDEDDGDEDDEDEDDDYESKPSFFGKFFGSMKSVFTKGGKKGSSEYDDEDEDEDDDDVEDDDDEDDDSDDEDDGDWQSDDIEVDEDDDDGYDDGGDGGGVRKKIVIAIVVVGLAVALALAIILILREPLMRLIGGTPEIAGTAPPAEDLPVVTDAPQEQTSDPEPVDEPVPDVGLEYRTAWESARSMSADGISVYSTADVPGIYIMTDDYLDVRQISDIEVLQACYANPWIYYSTYEGIFRLRYDDAGATTEQVVYENYTEPLAFFVLDGYLYYPGQVDGGLCNVCRISEDLSEHKILMERVSTDFLVDSNGVYTFGDESGTPAQNDIFANPEQPEDPMYPAKNLYFSDIQAQANWKIARMNIEEIVQSKPAGVVVKTRENGFAVYYYVSKDGATSSVTARDTVQAENGVFYELQDMGGHYTLVARRDGEIAPVVGEVQPFAYAFANNAFYYFAAAIDGERTVYHLHKFDFGSETDSMIADFGRINVNVADMASQRQVGFDKITPEYICFEGYMVKMDGSMVYYDRTTGSWQDI
jgi:hypothetical protein